MVEIAQGWRLLIAGSLLAMMATSAVCADTDKPRRGGTVITHMNQEQGVLNPALRASTGVYSITGRIMEPLVDMTAEGGFAPILATGWSSAADGKTITFELRQGVRWHDGVDFTCDDVAFSAMNLWKPLLNYSTTLQTNLEAVDCPDPHTALFRYSQPMPLNLLVAAMPYLGHPVPKHLYENTDILRNPYNTAPVGTGPFKFVTYERGQHIIAERNDDYWRGGDYPYLDRIVWRFITDKAAAAAALEAGELMESPFNSISMADMERLGASGKFDVGPQGYENDVAHSTIVFNLRSPILSNLKVRQAIYHALDLDFAIATIMRGYAKPGRGPVPIAGGKNYTDDVVTYPYDIERAKKLLDEAGFAPNSNGIRFKLRHRSAPWGEYTQLWGEYYAQAMREIGIDVELIANDAPGYLNGVYRDHDFDTANDWPIFRNDPAVSTMGWLQSRIPVGTPWTNQFGYQSDEMDRLIAAAAVELNEDKRADLYHQIQRLAMQDLPVIFALEHPFVGTTSKKLRNHHNMPRWNSSSWYDLWLEE